VLQCVADVLQCVAVCSRCVAMCSSCVAVCSRCVAGVLQCVAVCYSVLQCVSFGWHPDITQCNTACCSVVQCSATCSVCCSVLRSDGIVALRSVLQCVAVWFNVVQCVLGNAVWFIRMAS